MEKVFSICLSPLTTEQNYLDDDSLPVNIEHGLRYSIVHLIHLIHKPLIGIKSCWVFGRASDVTNICPRFRLNEYMLLCLLL